MNLKKKSWTKTKMMIKNQSSCFFFLVNEIKFFLTLKKRILKSTLNISLSKVLFQHTKWYEMSA
jgi:hypothetical protein